MTLESPPRLKHGELGPILRAADAPLAPERLASNHAAIKAAIAAGLARSLPLWVKIGLPLLLFVGGYAVYRGLARDEQPAPVTAVVATVTVDAAPVAPPIDAEMLVALDAAEVDAEPAPPPKKPSKPRVVIAAPPPDAAPPAPPPSDLPAQIALYEAARAAAARGDVAGGIARIDELFARFPSTPLRAEAELSRAEMLTRTSRLADAAAAIEALVASPAHRGRRGELLRTLGDIRRKRGDCAGATAAYTAARASKLSAAESFKVERGLERCRARR
jgi:hypothetical protein